MLLKEIILANKFHFGINPGRNRIAFENTRPYNGFKLNLIFGGI